MVGLFSYRQTLSQNNSSYRRAVALAALIVAALTAISLGAPEWAATLPTNARMIAEAPDLMTEAAMAAARRHGRVKGHVYVLVNNALPAANAEAILRAFAEYDPAGWSKTAYANATIYRQ